MIKHGKTESATSPKVSTKHRELLAHFSKPSMQRYSDVLMHYILDALTRPILGSAIVEDGWTEGEWSVAISFRQPGRSDRLGCRVSPLTSTSGDRIRFTEADALTAYPPNPAPIARAISEWMTEPIGGELGSLTCDSNGVLWNYLALHETDPETDKFGRLLSPVELSALLRRIKELDTQIYAMVESPRTSHIVAAGPTTTGIRTMSRMLKLPQEDVLIVFDLLPVRMRAEDYHRLHTERQWLSSWIARDQD